MKNQFIKATFCGAIAFLALNAAEAVSRPNIVLIMCDDLGYGDIGVHGNNVVKTPHLDALAARGTRFTDAYTPSPICVPARAAFATGRYPHQTGYWCNASPYAGTPPSWAHRLQAAAAFASVRKPAGRSCARAWLLASADSVRRRTRASVGSSLKVFSQLNSGTTPGNQLPMLMLVRRN